MRIYAVDPGDMRTRMQQDAFPGEDISDRPLPDASVPGLLALIEGSAPSGRYNARRPAEVVARVLCWRTRTSRRTSHQKSAGPAATT